MRGSLEAPWAAKPVSERGAPRIDPLIPNSRRGRRRASPIRQGRDKMEITVGVDVSKGRLDVHVAPLGESFALGNDEAGVAALVARLGALEGLIGEHADFHALFWLTAAIGAVAVVAIAAIVPESPVRTGGRIDLVGTVLLSGALV